MQVFLAQSLQAVEIAIKYARRKFSDIPDTLLCSQESRTSAYVSNY